MHNKVVGEGWGIRHKGHRLLGAEGNTHHRHRLQATKAGLQNGQKGSPPVWGTNKVQRHKGVAGKGNQ